MHNEEAYKDEIRNFSTRFQVLRDHGNKRRHNIAKNSMGATSRRRGPCHGRPPASFLEIPARQGGGKPSGKPQCALCAWKMVPEALLTRAESTRS